MLRMFSSVLAGFRIHGDRNRLRRWNPSSSACRFFGGSWKSEAIRLSAVGMSVLSMGFDSAKRTKIHLQSQYLERSVNSGTSLALNILTDCAATSVWSFSGTVLGFGS